MPCYEPPREEVGSVRTMDLEQVAKILDKANDISVMNGEIIAKNSFLEASVCAISNELERRGILEEVFQEASRKGKIDLMPLLIDHKNDDLSRLTSDIHKRYSVDEIEMIKQILISE